MYLQLARIVIIVKLYNVYADQVSLGVQILTHVLLYHHVVPHMTTVETVHHLSVVLLGVLLLTHVTIFQLFALTTITVKLSNVSVHQAKLGVQLAILV